MTNRWQNIVKKAKNNSSKTLKIKNFFKFLSGTYIALILTKIQKIKNKKKGGEEI